MRTLNLFLLFFFLFTLNSYSLPECTGKDSSVWDLCFGTTYWYEGEWKDGKKHGKGTSIHREGVLDVGTKYVGDWIDDEMHGQGTYTHRDGKKLVGEFKNGTTYGQVTVTYPNGSKYVGEWSIFNGGQRYGKGTMTYSDSGREISGKWKQDKLIK
jgi:hypothetical protein